MDLQAEVDKLNAEILKLRELAYDQHGDLYRDKFRNQTQAAQELLDSMNS